MPTETRTVEGSNVSQAGSVASASQRVDIPFDDGALQHQRLEMFEAQHVLDDAGASARFQNSTNSTTANGDQGQVARNAFYQARADEAIRQFDKVFNSSK